MAARLGSRLVNHGSTKLFPAAKINAQLNSDRGEDHENFTHYPACSGNAAGGNPCPCRSQNRRGGGALPALHRKDASGKWVGWEIDLVDALCAEMKEKCEIVETAWDGIIPALNASKIDVIIASMAKNAKRREVIDFSNTYYTSAAVMMGAKNGDMDFSPEHLAGKIIGVQVASIHAAYAEKYYGKTATIQTYQTQDEVNQDLAAGRIDYVLANGTTLDAFLKSEQGGTFEAKGAVPLDTEIIGEGAGAGIRKGDAALADKLNAALSALAKAESLMKFQPRTG
jgi:polar amino acid transport system substrate-binding protein